MRRNGLEDRVRSAFIQARGTTPQHAVAKAGGLRQNAISKLENNAALGPAVETFLKAVEGLGISVSAFFLQIEQARGSDKVGHKEKINVRLIPPVSKFHTLSSSGTLGDADGLDAALRSTLDPANLSDAARIALARALVEAGIRLNDPVGTAATEPDQSIPPADVAKPKRRHRRA